MLNSLGRPEGHIVGATVFVSTAGDTIIKTVLNLCSKAGRKVPKSESPYSGKALGVPGLAT